MPTWRALAHIGRLHRRRARWWSSYPRNSGFSRRTVKKERLSIVLALIGQPEIRDLGRADVGSRS